MVIVMSISRITKTEGSVGSVCAKDLGGVWRGGVWVCLRVYLHPSIYVSSYLNTFDTRSADFSWGIKVWHNGVVRMKGVDGGLTVRRKVETSIQSAGWYSSVGNGSWCQSVCDTEGRWGDRTPSVPLHHKVVRSATRSTTGTTQGR